MYVDWWLWSACVVFAKREELNLRMIERLYGRHYDMQVLYVSPEDVGHSGVARNRLYAILWLRAKVVRKADPTKLYKDSVNMCGAWHMCVCVLFVFADSFVLI